MELSWAKESLDARMLCDVFWVLWELAPGDERAHLVLPDPAPVGMVELEDGWYLVVIEPLVSVWGHQCKIPDV